MTKKEFIEALEGAGVKVFLTSRGFLYDLTEANKKFKASFLDSFTDEILSPLGNAGFLSEFGLTAGQWGLVRK